jgi:excinuclease ABC subunit C
MSEPTEFLLPKLPHSPGVYLMRDNAAAIIYIGKAKNLKKRVASYFLSSKLRDPKFEIFITSIRHVDYVVTASERDALVLERRLINRYKPAFNVMWKDDKSYPYLTLTLQEDFPRLFLTRIKKNDGALYFGPYPSVSRVRQLLKWSWRKKLFALRPCDLKIEEGKPWAYES